VLEKGYIRAWVADGTSPGERYVAVFNLGNSTEQMKLSSADLGVIGRVAAVRDLWTHLPVQDTDFLHATLRPHASLMYRVITPQ
jgi:hypothetical protein